MDLVLEAAIEEFRYLRGTSPAIQGIDFRVHSGEFVIVAGKAGSGKTTLCFCLTGIIPHFVNGHFKGTVRVKGQSLSELRLPEIAARLGFVLQRAENQLFNLTVAEDIAFGPENLCMDRQDILARQERSLRFVGMQALATRTSSSLSGGESQRVVLGCVLAMDPEVFVLDHPAAELDPLGRRQIYEHIHRLNKEVGKTIILVEDRLGDVVPFASRIVLMQEGRIVKDAPPEEFRGDENVLSSGIRIPERVKPPYVARGDKQASGTGKTIEVCDLSFRYPGSERWALKDIDLAFEAGELAAIVGENGAGKTTLARHFVGLLRPAKGKVLLGGRDTRGVPTAKLSDRVGYLFQDPDYQIFCNSVFDEVAFGLKIRRVPRREIEERVAKTLEKLGLFSLRECHPYALSRGQRQRLAMASILVREPEVLVVDEPTAGLDHEGTIGIMNLLGEFRDAGGTVVMISHDMEMVARYAERVIVMAEGSVLLDVATERLAAHSEVITRAGVELPGHFHLAGTPDCPSRADNGEEVVGLLAGGCS